MPLLLKAVKRYFTTFFAIITRSASDVFYQGNCSFDVIFPVHFYYNFRFGKIIFMNLLSFIYMIRMITGMAMPGQSSAMKDSSVIFTGTTPCSNVIRPLHKIKEEPDCKWNECHCMMVEWKLTLYTNSITHEPTGYKLTGINRFSVKETNLPSQPGTKAESEGKWSIVKGTRTNPGAVVYRLDPDKPKISVDMIKLGDNLLHILDHEGRLMIGNEFYSYTLNRVAN